MPKTNTIEKTKISIKNELTRPPMYRVIYYNDETTSFDFVITSLVEVFSYDYLAAQTIAQAVHEKGSTTVAVLSYEVAEQKTIEVLSLARINGYPLVVKVEPEN
jgi:ATP-dependent Clp protease adaptor protein ClpS